MKKTRAIVSYDISNDKSRRKTAAIFEAILTRVQYSVFEGDLPAAILGGSVKAAIRWLDPETDSVRVYRLCATCARKVDVYGKQVTVERDPVQIL